MSILAHSVSSLPSTLLHLHAFKVKFLIPIAWDNILVKSEFKFKQIIIIYAAYFKLCIHCGVVVNLSRLAER